MITNSGGGGRAEILPQGIWQGLSLGGDREKLGVVILNILFSNIYWYDSKSFFEHM